MSNLIDVTAFIGDALFDDTVHDNKDDVQDIIQ
jgi:hypothetical protein